MNKIKSHKDIRELYDSAYKKKNLSYKEADPEYLKIIRIQLIKDQKREFIIRILIICISIVIAFGIVFIFLLSMNIKSLTTDI